MIYTHKSPMIYTHKPWRVAAIQWNGDNWAEVEQFLIDNFGEDWEPRREPDDNQNAVQFHAWGDDQEVDPGRWIVVHLGLDTGEILFDDEFRAAYERAGAGMTDQTASDLDATTQQPMHVDCDTGYPVLTCTNCDESVHWIEAGDNLADINRAAAEHRCNATS